MSNKKKAKIPKAVTEPDGIVTFTYDGETYEIDRSVFADVDFHEAMVDGRDVVVVPALVTPASYRKFKATGKNGKRTILELREFGLAADEALGVEPGESVD